jgi:hypothetical protein
MSEDSSSNVTCSKSCTSFILPLKPGNSFSALVDDEKPITVTHIQPLDLLQCSPAALGIHRPHDNRKEDIEHEQHHVCFLANVDDRYSGWITQEVSHAAAKGVHQFLGPWHLCGLCRDCINLILLGAAFSDYDTSLHCRSSSNRNSRKNNSPRPNPTTPLDCDWRASPPGFGSRNLLPPPAPLVHLVSLPNVAIMDCYYHEHARSDGVFLATQTFEDCENTKSVT